MYRYQEIKDALDRKGLSQKEAAAIIGLPYQNLSSALRGKRDIPIRESVLLDELLGFRRGHIHQIISESKINGLPSLKDTAYAKTRDDILERIKANGGFWSYEGIPYEIDCDSLIEEGLLHLEFEDIPLLYRNWSEAHIRRVWRQRLLPQGRRLDTLNTLLGILFFNHYSDGRS